MSSEGDQISQKSPIGICCGLMDSIYGVDGDVELPDKDIVSVM